MGNFYPIKMIKKKMALCLEYPKEKLFLCIIYEFVVGMHFKLPYLFIFLKFVFVNNPNFLLKILLLI